MTTTFSCGILRRSNTSLGFFGHNDSITSVAFSPDGSLLASGSDDDTLRLWEIPDTRVNITALPVDAVAIGDKLTLNINITEGENVTGYQAGVRFDKTALRYVESVNGDYLPDNSFFVPPVTEEGGNAVMLGATSLAESSSGDGLLAALTFEFIAVKEAYVALEGTKLVNRAGEGLGHLHENDRLIVGIPRLREDVNLDGVVDLLDLRLVAASFGQHSETEDVNENGIVDIVDLVLVAGALGNVAAAPSTYPQALAMFTTSDVQNWLSQARQPNLTDAASQRGLLFLENLLAALTPKETALLPNYPNPFNPETWIPYQLSEDTPVSISIYDTTGQLVRILAIGAQAAGFYNSRDRAAYWDGKNAVGEPVASGVYFYTLTAGEFTATRKMLILK